MQEGKADLETKTKTSVALCKFDYQNGVRKKCDIISFSNLTWSDFWLLIHEGFHSWLLFNNISWELKSAQCLSCIFNGETKTGYMTCVV